MEILKLFKLQPDYQCTDCGHVGGYNDFVDNCNDPEMVYYIIETCPECGKGEIELVG